MFSAFAAVAHADATTVPLHDVTSPAHLRIEGTYMSRGGEITSGPTRFILAGYEPYSVLVTQETRSDECETSRYEFQLPGRRGSLLARATGTTVVLSGWIDTSDPREIDFVTDFWKPLLRHYFDPRVNSVQVLKKRAQFENWSTGTVARFWLAAGERWFIFDERGVLIEKRAGAVSGKFPGILGILSIERYHEEPYFPARLVHKRYDAQRVLLEETLWELHSVWYVSGVEELEKMLPPTAGLPRNP